MNVVFAGECGTGKSSLINMIVGREVAKTSNDSAACTTETKSYKASIDGCNLELWDTPGLDEGSTTRPVRSSETLVRPLLRFRNKGGIHLLVYCMHGNRAKAAHLKHYEIIRDLLPPTVPIVAIVTRLERYQDDMENWWANNARDLASHGMTFADHACVTTISNCHKLPSLFRERLVHSQRVVRDMIRRNCLSHLPSPVKFPTTLTPESETHRDKDAEAAGWQVLPTNVHTGSTARRLRTTLRLRKVSLFAQA